MKTDDIELVRGSGNVYLDFGYADADVRQLKSILAAQILTIPERDRLSVREAQRRTGIVAADFSRVRQVKLERFTMDRLLTIVDKLGWSSDRPKRSASSGSALTISGGRAPSFAGRAAGISSR